MRSFILLLPLLAFSKPCSEYKDSTTITSWWGPAELFPVNAGSTMTREECYNAAFREYPDAAMAEYNRLQDPSPVPTACYAIKKAGEETICITTIDNMYVCVADKAAVGFGLECLQDSSLFESSEDIDEPTNDGKEDANSSPEKNNSKSVGQRNTGICLVTSALIFVCWALF
eukprot:TRINITY_DN88235_c0_g1_i1.p1 TRINITY_DN88235_c0_g1~~TRINITY_DN88235_c0_g1_i1.p1  ORF type:complete len:172 (+),score=19.36 TRINITY_DN88235_c0_g1_i1:90-605(+)